MKRIFKILVPMAIGILLSARVFAQAPEKISYQAVIRNSSDALLANTSVGMQISIIHGSASGTVVYVETQMPTTNHNGLISIEIGGGTTVSGDFTTIDWANGPYFVKTETDLNGGTAYSITGTIQFFSCFSCFLLLYTIIWGLLFSTIPYPLHGFFTISGVTRQ